MIRRFLLSIPLCALVASASLADDNKIDCSNTMNGYEERVCAKRFYDRADAKLNSVWKQVLADIKASDLEPPWDAKTWTKKLRKAQRAWIAYRDADCEGAVPMEWSGGTITTTMVLGCMTDKTVVRTNELVERYGLDGRR